MFLSFSFDNEQTLLYKMTGSFVFPFLTMRRAGKSDLFDNQKSPLSICRARTLSSRLDVLILATLVTRGLLWDLFFLRQSSSQLVLLIHSAAKLSIASCQLSLLPVPLPASAGLMIHPVTILLSRLLLVHPPVTVPKTSTPNVIKGSTNLY